MDNAKFCICVLDISLKSLDALKSSYTTELACKQWKNAEL